MTMTASEFVAVARLLMVLRFAILAALVVVIVLLITWCVKLDKAGLSREDADEGEDDERV